jgi:uncharacterized membrane protein
MKNFKRILGRGLALAVPLAIILYVFMRIVGIFEKVISPVAAKMGIQKVLGELTLTIFAVILIIIIILLLGVLMQISVVSTVRSQVEDVILRLIPSLNQLKLMAADNLDLENAENAWRPVLLYTKEKAKYNPAFVVEEDDEFVTLFICLETNIKRGEISIINKEKINLIPITYGELRWFSRAAGKGYLKLIRDYNDKAL